MKDRTIKDGLLREMGIESWYLRPKEKPENEEEVIQSAPDFLKSDPEENRIEKKSLFEKRAPSVVKTDHEAFKFSFLNSKGLVLVFSDELTNIYQRVLTDLINSFELLSDSIPPTKGKPGKRISVFEWPLVEGEGDPAKALSVFFDKYYEEGKKIVICESAFKLIQSHIAKELIYQEVPDVSQIVSSNESKKIVWEVLKSITK